MTDTPEPRYRKGPDGRWPDQAKADALMRYQIDGPAEASRQLGIPEPTIIAWAQQAGIHAYALSGPEHTQPKTHALNWEQRRRNLADRSHEVAAEALERLHKIATADRGGSGRDFQAFAVGYAVLVDKAKQLRGGGVGDTPGGQPNDPAVVRAHLDGMLADLEHQPVRHDQEP
jgi:hypothetical protein